MKVGVYDRYWNTMGGGEVYAGSIAEVLGRIHDVDLLSEGPIDRDGLEARLGLDLARSRCRELGEVDDDDFRELTAPYDLFFNCTYGSTRPSAAGRSFYVVYFPPVEGGVSPLPLAIAGRLVKRHLSARSRLEWASGFHEPEAAGERRWRWTTGTSTLVIRAPRPADVIVRLRLCTEARPTGAQAEVRVRCGGIDVGRVPAGVSGLVDVAFPARIDPKGLAVELETPAFVPSELADVDDDRRLGVQIEGVEVRRRGRLATVASVAQRSLGLPLTPTSHIEDYDAILAISRFTQRWVWRTWGRPSRLLYPPVRPRQSARKERVILSVGRFFGRESGHSKKQLEMVQAFRLLLPLLPEGWSLHLVGGCSDTDRPYLDDVRAAAADLPIHIHPNAPASVLDDLYARASVYWHLTGIDEDLRRQPDRFEHFGISVVEAMSAGAVPLVLGAAGPAEVVRDGVDGIHVASVEELATATAQLLSADRLEVLAESARRRSADYAPATFAERLMAIVGS